MGRGKEFPETHAQRKEGKQGGEGDPYFPTSQLDELGNNKVFWGKQRRTNYCRRIIETNDIDKLCRQIIVENLT